MGSKNVYGGRRKTRANSVISRNLANAQTQGKPSAAEELFNEYQISRGLELDWDRTRKFVAVDEDTGKTSEWDFQLDFSRRTRPETNKWPGEYDLNIEISGEHFHSKKSKESWKNRVKNAYGLKVIVVPTEMCEKKWWSILDDELPKAIISPKSVEYLDEYAST